MRLIIYLLLVIGTSIGIAGCGGSGSTQISQTEHYAVAMTMDGASLGERSITVAVNDQAGHPVEAEQVTIFATMAAMEMTPIEVPARSLGSGRYQADDVFFSMLGDWDMEVRVRANGTEETAKFKLQIVD